MTSPPFPRISVVHWNARGLSANRAELLSFLSSSPDLIFVSETFLSASSSFSVPGYSIHLTPSLSPHSGGLACLVSSPIASFLSPLPLPSPSPFFAFFRLLSRPFPLTIASVYLPPSSPLSLLDSLFLSLRSLPPPWLVVGDFNAHNPLWGSPSSCSRGSRLEAFLSDLNLFVLNNDHPTYLNSARGTFSHLDLALASPSVARLASWTVLPDSLGSDHFPCWIDLGIAPPRPGGQRPPVWNLRRADWPAFGDVVDRLLDTHPCGPADSLDTCYNIFIEALLEAAHSSVPVRRVGTSRRSLVPWWNDECSSAVRAKRRAYHRLRCSSTPGNLDIYRRCRALARRTIRAAQSAAWRRFCSTLTFRTPLTNIWRFLHSSAHSQSRSQPILPSLDLPDKFIELRRTFTSDIPQQTVSVSQVRLISHQVEQLLSTTCSCASLLCRPFTVAELDVAIGATLPSSPGADNLPPSFLPHLSPSARLRLLHLFNLSWSSSSIPSSWSHSLIVPILKPSRPSSSPSSFRPISLTSALCRLMERILHRRILWFLSATNHLSPHQYGFLPGRSTHQAHLILEHDIRSGFHRRAETIACFLDLENAFDSVWHQGLLLKCSRIGLPSCCISWINALLRHRTFQLVINQTLSDPFETHNGTPQGSALSPLLFNIMLHDLPEVLPPEVRVSLYADDICVWTTGTDRTRSSCLLQDALDRLEGWARDWGFRFAPAKSRTLIFSRRRSTAPAPCLLFGSTPIPTSDHHRFLGIVFDRRLSWNHHLTYLRGVCSKRLHLLRFICGHSWGASRDSLLQLYKALIRPFLDYGASLFLQASSTFHSGLETIQANSLRVATGLLRSTPQIALQVDTGLEPIRIRHYRLSIRMLLRSLALTPETPIIALFTTYHSGRPLSWRFTRPAIAFCAEILQTPLPQLPFLPSPLSSPTWFLYPFSVLLPPLPSRVQADSTVLRTLFLEATSERFASFVRVYTDGSFSPDTGVSAASFFIPQLGTSTSFSLPPHTGIFHAELFAILAALRHFSDREPCQVVIFSDSRAALDTLRSCSSTPIDSLHHDIIFQHHLLLCGGFDVVLHWVPAHCGVPGNEEADRLSRMPQDIPRYQFPININEVTNRITSPLIEQWQDTWDRGQTARHFHDIKSTVAPWSHFNQGPRAVTTLIGRLRTGHCVLRHSLHQHGVVIDPHCRFCGSLETISHILLECPHLRVHRDLYLTPHLQLRPPDIPPLVFLLAGGAPPFPAFRTIYQGISQFFHESGIRA